MNRRLISFIVICVIVLAGVGGLLYYFSKKQSQNTTGGSLEIKKVLDEPVVSPIGAFDNNSIWYFNFAGRLFQVNTDGSNLSEYPLPSLSGNISNVLWPKNGYDFITLGSSGKSYYDSSSKIFVSLPQNIRWIEWLPDGKRVLYIWQSDDKKSQSLVRANGDGTGYETIASVFWPDLAIKSSPDGKTALLYRTMPEGDINKIYFIDLDTKEITTIIDTGLNTNVQWFTNSNKFIFERNSKLYLFDVATKHLTDLNLNTSLSKTAMDPGDKYLYAKLEDSFVKLNLETLAQENYFQSNVPVKDLILVGSSIYYTNSEDNKLYTISKE